MKLSRAVLAIVLGITALSLSLPTRAGTQSTPPVAAPTTAAPQIESQPAFTVIGVSVRTDNHEEAGGNGMIPQLWQRVMQEGLLENVPSRADGNLTVVYTNYASDNSGEYTYVLGVRVTSVDKVPDAMVAVNVPAGRYAVVESDKGSLQEVMPKVWRRINTTLAGQLGGPRAFKADFEVYPEGFDWQNAQIGVHLGLK
jgi:predicted transcriptional regulator YdeE